MPIPGQGKRIQQLVLELAAKLNRRITLADFGELVGKAEKGRGRAYSATAVSEWIQERNEPTIAAFQAIAKVSGHSFESVALGEEGEARPPVLPVAPAQTESELKRRRRRRA